MANILEATKCDDKKRERDGKAARLKFTYATFASFVQNVSTPENLQKALDRYNSIYSALLSAVERKEKEDAEKKANELKEKSLTNNIIKEKFIEKWDGVLPKVTGSNAILDIDSIIK